MAVTLYNTLTRKKEAFVPIEEGKVKFYTCGPTVYDYIHIGNGRAFVVSDVLRRFLFYAGFEVTYVMNLTDIDDRIIERAITEKTTTEAITEKYIAAFFEDIAALGVKKADFYPKATEHIPEIISLIKKLIDNGMAYVSGEDVFYDVSSFANYGQLSGKNLEDLRAGARIAVDEKKRNPLDFALWKGKKPGEPSWDSPWGPGRPGWHIECSAMSMKLLGESFDIHAGGVDLVFPHHENEIAQSEAATNRKFVKYWLHNGFLQIEGDKMAKSLGNFRTVRDVLQGFPAETVRLFFLQKHYRSPIDFSVEALTATRNASERLQIFYEKLVKATADTEADGELVERFATLKQELIAALEDDFNTPVAIARFFDIVKEANKHLDDTNKLDSERGTLMKLRQELERLNDVFGIIRTDRAKDDSGLVDILLGLLVDLRNQLRAKKEWKLADQIRDELATHDIVLEDKAGETFWRIK